MLSTHGLRFGLVRKELNQYINSINFTGVYAVMELGTIVAFIDKKLHNVPLCNAGLLD